MAYRFRQHESAPAAVRRIAGEEIDRAVRSLQNDKRSAEVRVHEARKSSKKLRALLRLAQKPLTNASIFKKENRWFRNTARRLSALRDADATRECIRRLQRSDAVDAPTRAAFAALRAAIGREKPTSSTQPDADAIIDRAAKRFADARLRIDRWPFDDDAGFEFISHGFGKCYRKARQAMRRAVEKPTVEHMHEWRKRVKDHRYHVQLLRGPWKLLGRVSVDELKQLSDALGEHHDLAVLRSIPTLDSLKPNHRTLVLRLIDRESDRLEMQAKKLGRELFGTSSKRLTADLAQAWARWTGVKPGLATV